VLWVYKLSLKCVDELQSNEMDKYIRKILEADIYDLVQMSPLTKAPRLSSKLGAGVMLKREDQQEIFSFKVRGAYNLMRQMPRDAARRGVVAASAGNHAQGVALAGQHLGIPVTIVMGVNTPAIKRDAVSARGATVILRGENFDDASAHAVTLAKVKGLTIVPPFDHDDVIAGQGTIGMEILRQASSSLNAIFIPVGGGGLIAGVASYVKAIRPGVKIIGVEAEGSAGMTEALKAGRRVKLSAQALDQFADGTAVRQVGTRPFQIAKQAVDAMVTVSVDEICAAIKDIFEDTRVLCEPAGALSIAGLKKWLPRQPQPQRGDHVAVVSGANINFDRLRHISERTALGEKKELLLGVTIPERPGSFLSFCRALGRLSITEFNYRYADPGEAHVLLGVETDGLPATEHRLIERLGRRYPVTRLSENELAVLHVRHMVGGRSTAIEKEQLYRVEFPERPGALLKFLEGLGSDYNISLFHYRNHGSAFGRVLIGIERSSAGRQALSSRLRDIGYRFWEESANPARDLFL